MTQDHRPILADFPFLFLEDATPQRLRAQQTEERGAHVHARDALRVRVSADGLSSNRVERLFLEDIGFAEPVVVIGHARRPALDPGSANGFDIDTGVTLQPTSALRTTLGYTKARLTRRDTGLVAFDDNIYRLRATYQFTRFLFARGRIDYGTLSTSVRGQFLFGWTPNPGTSFFVGYNDDLQRNGFNPFTQQLEPGLRRNGRTFFIKASYLIRRSI